MISFVGRPADIYPSVCRHPKLLRFRETSLWTRKRFGMGIFFLCSLACGARSGLHGAEPCAQNNEARSCQGICGEGTTTCEGGFWTPCLIAEASEPCDNSCGTGLRSCRQEKWSDCQVAPVVQECSFGCGSGTESCIEGEWGICDAPPPLPPTLTATIRDFLDTHPDFERPVSGDALELGLVDSWLGEDDKPVYTGDMFGTVTTAGTEFFDQWYRDVPGINESTIIELPMQESPKEKDFYVYESHGFFPIDDQLLGNQGRPNNYHFTLEANGTFRYKPGQVFRFNGDDDVWVFINRSLVIDLGGMHQSLSAEVVLAEVADDIGLEEGGEYSLHFFFAERHTIDSNFVLETSIANLGQCPE